MQRDPHLPPPNVVDWLADQEWSEVIPETVITYPKGNPTGVSRSELFEFSSANVAIGADETCRLFLPIEALEALRADQAERARIEAEQARTKTDEERRKAERDMNRPCELGLLPMITSETGADDEPEIKRIICSAISGGADYLNDMPREVSLERITAEGTFCARYLQEPDPLAELAAASGMPPATPEGHRALKAALAEHRPTP